MKKVSLLIIATGKYSRFVQPLTESVALNFMPDCKVDIHLFCDSAPFIKSIDTELFHEYGVVRTIRTFFHHIDHEPFPGPTLHRFHYFKQYKNALMETGSEYLFYIDVDTLIKDVITSEILSDRVAVQHCGYVGRKGPFENRPGSTSYVPLHERHSPYFGGGFWGFSSREFWRLVDVAIRMIDEDAKNGIVPTWHDESVLNRYLIERYPTKILSPSYHYPEGNIEYYKKMWPEDYPCKILLLDKDHKEIRS